MMMVELAKVPVAALPLSGLAAHLRLAQGFADDGTQNAQLETALRAALAAIEARVAKALLRRAFAVTLLDWPESGVYRLPIAPVVSVDGISRFDGADVETVVAPGAYRLIADTHAPAIEPVGGSLPSPGRGGRIEITVTAGYSDTFDDLPSDLQQAVLVLAGAFWAQDLEPDAGLPFVVSILLEPYRKLRLREVQS